MNVLFLANPILWLMCTCVIFCTYLFCRLKDHTLSLVKIADFGLSDFYRPGATMKSSCGTLSFLAPEVFKGTANAGTTYFSGLAVHFSWG